MGRLSRREFLASGAVALAGGALAARAEVAMPPVCVFSKHLQFLDCKTLARTCRELGLDGIDLTVREGGHVLPENVGRDLPAAVEAIRAEGLEVPMITTRLQRGDDPSAEPILKTASELGIKYFRVGGHKYTKDGDPLQELEGFTQEMRGLTRLAKQYGMVAGYHNHSGPQNVGAPLWDLHRMFEAIDSPHLGSNFDVGHATVEGAFGDWQITARVLAPYTHMIAVKDFEFDRGRPRWVPLGKGIVPLAEYFRIFRAHDFAGPVSVHVEYGVPSHDAMLEEVREGAVALRRALRRGGYR